MPPVFAETPINGALLRQIPPTVTRILDVGCGNGSFGRVAKASFPTVYYAGIEVNFEKSAVARQYLDHVETTDFESAELLDQKFDCIIFGDVLEHLNDPVSAMIKASRLIHDNGVILCSVPNVQHFSVLKAILSGDFQYQDSGILDRTHRWFLTYSNFIKWSLDAGLLPELVDSVEMPPDELFLQSLQPAIQSLRMDPKRSRAYLTAHQYIFRCWKNLAYQTLDDQPAFPLTFIVPTNNRDVLSRNFLASPIFRRDSPHRWLAVENATSAAAVLTHAIPQVGTEFVVYCQHDVYLPEKWDRAFCSGIARSAAAGLDGGVFGVVGALKSGSGVALTGHVIDRHWWRRNGDLPRSVDTVDELLFGFRAADYLPLDANLGFHLYAADFSCRLKKQAGKNTVVVDAPCFHNSSLGETLPQSYVASAGLFARNWSDMLPLATTSALIQK